MSPNAQPKRREVRFTVNAKQLARLRAEAKAAGVSLACWVREAALKVCGPIAPRLPVELHAMIATDRITIAGIPAPDAPVAIPPVTPKTPPVTALDDGRCITVFGPVEVPPATPKTRRCTGCGDDPMLIARDRDGKRVCGRCKRVVT